MTDWTPPVPKSTDRTDVLAARHRLDLARAELQAARLLLLRATGSFDTEKLAVRQLDPLLAQLAALDAALRPWSA